MPHPAQALLTGLCTALRARVVEPFAHVGPRHARDVDWGLVSALQPGEVLTIDGLHRQRSARLAAGAGYEVYARGKKGTRSGSLKGLRIVADTPPDLTCEELAGLADLESALWHVTELTERQAVDERERSLGRRASTLTHDLRNQLTLALFTLERLRVGDDDDSRFDSLDALEGVLCAARDLCADSLTSGAHAPDAKPLFLRTVMLEAARTAPVVARASAIGRDVRVHVRCPSELRVRGSLSALSRLVKNLVANAVEASYAGGEVRVDATDAQDGDVLLSVEDFGRGIAAENLTRLLDSGQSGGGGTGYGSASIGECLAALRAELELETAQGAGSLVTVRLRGVPADSLPMVVLVDADAERRKARGRALRQAGFGVLDADTPRAGRDALRASDVQFLVLARGTFGDRLDALFDEARRGGVPVQVWGCRDGGPAELVAQLASPPPAAAASRGS